MEKEIRFWLVVGCLTVGFALGVSITPNIKKQMGDGHYEVYYIQKMFNAYDGEPTYWVLATKSPAPGISSATPSFYEIPRKKIVQPPPDNKPDPPKTRILEIKNGSGVLLEKPH
jgi:hypothetical protein